MSEQVETWGRWNIYQDATLEQHIRERAYFMWLEAGCPDGRDDEFWLSAERELLQSPKIKWRGPSYIIEKGVIHCPYIPEEFNSPVVDGIDFTSTEEVTIELTKRYEPTQNTLSYEPTGRTREDPVASRASALIRFGRKLLDKVKGKSE